LIAFQQVLVWHTQTVKKVKHNLKVPSSIYTTLRSLLEELVTMGVVQLGGESSAKEVYMVVDGQKQKVSKQNIFSLS
jgi:hypothetical protein